MRRTDRWIGALLAGLGLAVLWSARGFPNVPGQRLGAGFLPLIVGAGLIVCAVALVLRGAGRGAEPGVGVPDAEPAAPAVRERLTPPLVVMAAVAGYIALADRLGFLLVAPLCLVALFRALGVPWRAAVWWALGGTVVVHLAFYKLLRVPLPWGLLRPFY